MAETSPEERLQMAVQVVKRLGVEAVCLDGYPSAFRRLQLTPVDGVWQIRFVYSVPAICRVIESRDGMARDDALEFFYSNIECAVKESEIVWEYEDKSPEVVE